MCVFRSFLPATCSLLPSVLLLAAEASGQPPSTNANAVAEAGSTPAKTQKFADLTIRYRFSERFTTDDDKTGPGVVGSYRVATLDVIRDSIESAQGAPRRTELTRRAIYSERPAEFGFGVGNVASSVRVFEKYQSRPEDLAKGAAGPMLEGTTVLVRARLGDLPTVLCLTEGRTLSESEFEAISRQVYVPHLPALLPSQVVRLGDNWRIPRKAAQALLGDPSIQGDTLVGRLAEVRKEIDGPRLVASIAITGKVASAVGETAVNAEALFTFQGAIPLKDPAKKPSFPPRPAEDMMEARGSFTELRLARVTSGPLPGPGRLRFQSNRELTLHRQLGIAAGGVAPPLLEKAPEPTDANSWLTHVDPSGRYALRHPQDMLTPDRSQPTPEPNTTLLIRTRREGRDMLQVEFVPKTLAPEDLKKKLTEKYTLMKMEVLKGEETWLPEAEWPKMRVHRVDAALKVADPKAAGPGAPTRIHFDGYLIQFSQSSSILAIATTSREAAGPFREEVEKILKTIQLDPPRSTPG